MSTITRSGFTYHDASNARIRKIGSLAGPASYTTGGDPVTAAEFGCGKIDVVLFECFTNGTDLRLAVYLPATGRLKFFDLAGSEIANGTNLSAYSARFEAIGY